MKAQATTKNEINKLAKRTKIKETKIKHKGKRWDNPSVRDEIIEVALIKLKLIDPETKMVIE